MENIAQHWKKLEKKLFQRSLQDFPAKQILFDRASSVDDLLIKIAKHQNLETLIDQICLVALGGYGRRELNKFSDIDLMILHGKKDFLPAQQSQQLIYPLWDIGFHPHVILRSIEGCLEVMNSDSRSEASLLEARLIAGNKTLYAEFDASLKKYWARSKNRVRFVERKKQEWKRRLEKQGNSIYLLEPNIKEGKGGLRDYHYLVWIATALNFDLYQSLDDDDQQNLARSLDFLWRLRDIVHSLHGRRNDKLNFSLQEEIAPLLGFQSSKKATAAQKLMQYYYSQADTVKTIVLKNTHYFISEGGESFLKKSLKKIREKNISLGCHKLDNELICKKISSEEHPALWGLKVISLARRKNLKLSIDSKALLSTVSKEINLSLWDWPEVSLFWKNLFKNPRGISQILFDMHEMGWIIKWFPEWAHLNHFAARDAYHKYTVDIHTLKAIEELELILTKREVEGVGPIFLKVASKISQPELLFLGIFFHDIGKGCGAEDHSEHGTKLAKLCLERLNLSEEQKKSIFFLIRSHLIMPRLAFLRDISDPHLIEKFSNEINSILKLRLLFLMSYADLKGVAPGVLTSWKQKLLSTLYQRSLDYLEGVKQKNLEKNSQIQENLLSELKKGDDLFAIHIESRAGQSYEELFIAVEDRAGLFSMIAGLLSASGFNVLSGSVQTLPNSVAMDSFLIAVDNDSGNKIEKWNEFRTNFKNIALNKANLVNLLSKKSPTGWVKKDLAGLISRKVIIDQEISPQYTVLEVHAEDRFKLLYDISEGLYHFSLSIHKARISTEGSKAIDVFYLTDENGEKITDKNFWKKVKVFLLERLK